MAASASARSRKDGLHRGEKRWGCGSSGSKDAAEITLPTVGVNGITEHLQFPRLVGGEAPPEKVVSALGVRHYMLSADAAFNPPHPPTPHIHHLLPSSDPHAQCRIAT